MSRIVMDPALASSIVEETIRREYNIGLGGCVRVTGELLGTLGKLIIQTQLVTLEDVQGKLARLMGPAGWPLDEVGEWTP